MTEINILLKDRELKFIGKYLPERQTDNWHYYEDNKWTIYHIKKSEMVAVLEFKY